MRSPFSTTAWARSEVFRTLTLADAVSVTTRMRKVDADCIEAVTDGVDAEQFAYTLWRSNGPAWTLLQDGEPVAIGGVETPVPWSGRVWMVCTDGLSPASWKKLIRHGRIVLSNASKRLRRVECHVLSTWTEAHAFACRQGFELEGVRHGAGRDGQDLLTMVYREKL
jgi:hypothetical protein